MFCQHLLLNADVGLTVKTRYIDGRLSYCYHQLQPILLESWLRKIVCTESDSLWSRLNGASLSGFEVR